jgi:hypothetical protein
MCACCRSIALALLCRSDLLRLATDVSSSYDMRQLLGKVMDTEVKKIVEAWPKDRELVAFFSWYKLPAHSYLPC